MRRMPVYERAPGRTGIRRQFSLVEWLCPDTDSLTTETLHLACEEAALASAQSVPSIQILTRTDMLASSDGHILFLSSGISNMAAGPLQAYLGLCLNFHHQYSSYLRARRAVGSSLGERAVSALRRASRRLLGQRPGLATGQASGTLPPDPEEELAHRARQRSFSRLASGDGKLLQALLLVQAGFEEEDDALPGAPLFADSQQLGELARFLEMLLEGAHEPTGDALPWPQASKLLRLAHKTSLLIELGSNATEQQVAGLNRLYAPVGPVGSLAYVIRRLVNEPQSDYDRVNLLVEVLTSAAPVQARLQLVDLAASRLLKLPAGQRQTLLALLRDALGEKALKDPLAGDEEAHHILAWTLFSVLRGKIQPHESPARRPEPLSDRDKRRCLAKLLFVASEMAGEEESISARTLRNQLDKVSEALDIDRPVSAPDVFQAAAWTETLEDLTRLPLHDSLSLIDALAEWGRDSDRYQTWLDALCHKLNLQREDARPVRVRTVLSEDMHQD